ncbi:hypothetical protein [Geomonas sp.]|uniref:hypothetical protein n=1 Tax=Geomonas sp. TaxID=2651584 RepID=UPI002B4A04A0|nr:hypothetical protein [Geomonas sp.]HJV35849.1 hypothetical protein [Geomonas sp.]
MPLEKRPTAWLVLLMGYLAVACLGFIDYLTGNYSLLIFYVLPVLVVSWKLGVSGAVMISLASGLARTIADYYSYPLSTFRYWNSLEDMLFLLMVSFLIVFMKKVLDQSPD